MTTVPVNPYGIHPDEIFDPAPGRLSFQCSIEGMEHFCIRSGVISAYHPLNNVSNNEDATIAFFDGILPAGQRCGHLAKQSGSQ